MIALIQRVSEASVSIEESDKGRISEGVLVLLGIGKDDTDEDIEYVTRKVCNMRIFSDEAGKMNLSVKDIGGNILLISQFTLHASTKKGNRPSFVQAAKPDKAIPLYEKTIKAMSKEVGQEIETGEFGGEMKVRLLNEGPVTIILDSKNRR